jgi:DNA polymerase phi
VSAYKALLKSSLLTDSTAARTEDWEKFLEMASEQARSGPWLREECGSMLCEFVTASSKAEPLQEKFVLKIIENYSTNGLLQTAEGVALWLTVQEAFPELKLPKDVWHKRDPLHSKERSRLARVLCDPDSGKDLNTEQKKKFKSGTWKPQPNFAWRVVMQHAFEKFPSSSKLKQFCIEILDSRYSMRSLYS